MVKDKEEMFSTNLRIPKHLQHKLNILSDSDDRSFNSYVIKILQDHVIEFEKDMAHVYGLEEFFEMHDSIFGKEFAPYYNEDVINSDIEQTKTIIKDILRGSQKSTKKVKRDLDQLDI